jgi:hypothetical protein
MKYLPTQIVYTTNQWKSFVYAASIQSKKAICFNHTFLSIGKMCSREQ